MGSKTSKIRTIRKTPSPGSVPGTFSIQDDALKPRITIYSYNKEVIEETQVQKFQDLKKHFEKCSHLSHWIDVRGLGDRQFLEDLADYFSIHRLVLADVVNVYQRPKLEEHKNHLYMVSRMIFMREEALVNEQVSVFLGSNYVISLQEGYEDMLNPVRDRLRMGKGYIRSFGPDFLAYAILDAILDNFFPLMEKISDRMDALETELIAEMPKRAHMNRIQSVKRELITIRRVLWQERDKLNDLLRTHTTFVTDSVKLFIRDAYDHSIQLMDITDSYKEITSSMMDIYLSSVNNRMNQIMKILAVISTIFIPLTFIVGVYGMNFSRLDPETGKVLPMNMPELYSPYGYLGVMIFMALMIIVQMIFFYKKGWMGKS